MWFLCRETTIINIKTNILFPSIKMCLYSIICCVVAHSCSVSKRSENLTLAFSTKKCVRSFWSNSFETVDDYFDEWDLNKRMWTGWTAWRIEPVSGFSTEMNCLIRKYQLARCRISFLFLKSKHPFACLIQTSLKNKFSGWNINDHSMLIIMIYNNEISLTNIEGMFETQICFPISFELFI